MILGAALSYSTLSVFSQILTNQNIDLFNQVFWRTSVAALFAGILLFVTDKFIKLSKSNLYLILVNAFLSTFATITFSGQIYFGIPIAKAMAINYAYPLPVIILSYLLFKQLPSRRQFLAFGISLLSLVFILEVWHIKGLAQFQMGEILALGNSIFFGALIVWAVKIRKETLLTPLQIFFYMTLFTAPAIVLLGTLLQSLSIPLLNPNLLINFGTSGWLALISISIVGMLIPVTLVFSASKHLSSNIISILLLTEIIWVNLLGVILFNQHLSIFGILGSLGIITSILLL